MTTPRARSELARTLHRLRTAAGLTLAEVAERAGVSTATVSRLENDKYAPTPTQVEALARAVTAPSSTRRRLVSLAQDLRERTAPRQVLIRAGAATAQRKYGEIEAGSGHVQSFSPVMVVGLLQTPEYARAVFRSALPDDQIDAAVQARLERQRRLADPDEPTFTQIMTEGALRWRVGPRALMVEQCQHVAALATAGYRLRVGIIPWTRETGIFPLHGFDLYDERAVIMGALTGTAYLTTPGDVADYVKLFERLAASALFDGDAVPEFERIAQDYRDTR